MLPLLFASFLAFSLPQHHQIPCHNHNQCGNLQIPFPFYFDNSSCDSLSISIPPFHLFCFNSTSLFLNITSQSYRVLRFFSDGVLVDFPDPYPSSCRPYYDFKSFGFSGNRFFGISIDNVIGLYDCDDSLLCKAGCDKISLMDCDGKARNSPACCYPLNEFSIWNIGDDFSVFYKYGCRGFSSWVVERGSNTGTRGVKLEWGIPRNLSYGMCADNAYVVNSTAIRDGVRCLCPEGYVGDGFAHGLGCFKSCIKDGQNAYGNDCDIKGRHSEKKLVILTGVLAPLFIVASLVGLFCLLKRPTMQSTFDSDCGQLQSNMLLQKTCSTRLFTYHELEKATRGFGNNCKLVESSNGVIFTGILGDGLRVAVHRLHCENEGDLINVLSQIEVLHSVAHKNVAHILGCCIDSGFAPLVVYEHPANGTLEKHLNHHKGKEMSLDWCKRLRIATETASVLSFLQYEVSPPILHHHLISGHIFLDDDFSAKISGFRLLSSSQNDKSHLPETSPFNGNDVYDFGVVLLEMITGFKNSDLPMVALQKIRSGKVEEVVDPLLYHHEQPTHSREQIEIVADLATRCLLFGGDGKLKMTDVLKELTQITRESIDGGNMMRGSALEETFSNSSLLQMISMSPDSILVP